MLTVFFLIFAHQNNKVMKTKKTSTKVVASTTKEKETPKQFSKTWLAVLANKGTGEILDMRAVLK